MTDERYVYVSDIKERKGMASGARGKKNGSKSKRCSLPSDNLSAAQLKKLNGPVSTVQLNQPISWRELMELSPTLRFLYLDNLINKHHARQKDILEMLGVASSTFWRMSKDLPDRLIFQGHQRKIAPEWTAFLEAAAAAQEAPTPSADVTPAEPEPAAPTVKQAAHVVPVRVPVLMSGSFTVTGTLGDLVEVLCRVFVDEPHPHVFTVNFRREEAIHDQAS